MSNKNNIKRYKWKMDESRDDLGRAEKSKKLKSPKTLDEIAIVNDRQNQTGEIEI